MDDLVLERILTMQLICLLLLLPSARSQESTPSSLLRRNHNHHPFDAVQFLKNLRNFKVLPTKQGPVLFPNDAPPAPRTPLIVTSRPLAESIARSELASVSQTTARPRVNVTQDVSQTSASGHFVPYLARVPEYRPYNLSPNLKYTFTPTQIPYSEVVRKNNLLSERDSRYDYEESTSLPPIYKVLADNAEESLQTLKQRKYNNNYYKAPIPDYRQNYQNNKINDDYDQNDNYAFSYRVNDKKTGDDFSHTQHSSGSATNGEYRVRLPDGRTQIVSYTADENGYKADVRYDDNDKENNYNNENKIDYNYNYNDRNEYLDRNVHKNNDLYDKYYVNNQVDFRNDYTDRKALEVTTEKSYYVDRNPVDNDFRNDYSERYIPKVSTEKPLNEKDEYYYTDVSKENNYNDYSSEYNNYEPHRSKFNFANKNEPVESNVNKATVKPSYEELKELFTQNYAKIDLINPTTPTPFEGTTERVVVIGTKAPNLYTNIRNSIPNIPTYASPKVIVASTPKTYLVSTIASLKNKVHLASRPVLSDSYINKINKYLSFN